MPFITQGKANIKYLLIVVLVAAVAGGIIFTYWKDCQKEIISLNKFTEIKMPEKKIKNKPDFIKVDYVCEGILSEKDWQICRTKEYNFEFKYPILYNWDSWKPTIVITDCDYKKFLEKCPDQGEMVDAVAKAGIEVGPLNPEQEIQRKNINNNLYCFYSTYEGAAGTTYIRDYYITIKNNKCFTFYSAFSYGECENIDDAVEKGEHYKDCLKTVQGIQEDYSDKVPSSFKFLDQTGSNIVP